MSLFGPIDELAPIRIWEGVLGRSLEGEKMTLAVIELDPDSVVPEHRHENEQIGVLIEGSLAMRIGDETRELGPGAGWVIPADAPHEVTAGAGGAVVVEAFAPARDDWGRLERLEPGPGRWP
ncbi:MAG: cupin domain-containing protein [Gaiellaceae bacterium]